MNIVTISGSHRLTSQSEKVGRFINASLTTRHPEVEASLLALAGNPLPLWDEGLWQNDAAWQARLAPMAAQLEAADGFVVVSPEYHGQVPAGLKNFFLMWSHQLAHKPALLVGVSSSMGGANVIAELRMSSYKNNRIAYLPEHLIIRNVEKVLNADAASNDAQADGYLRARINYATDILVAYAQALGPVRASGVTSLANYKFGMS